MSSANRLFYYIFALVAFAGAIILTMQLVDLQQIRENFVIQDMSKKSGVELNIDASGGINQLTAAQVTTNLLAHPSNLTVRVNGTLITPDLLRGVYSSQNAGSIIQSGNYRASYTYDANGIIAEVNYISVP